MDDLMTSYALAIGLLLFALHIAKKTLGDGIFRGLSRSGKKAASSIGKGTVKVTRSTAKYATRPLRRRLALPSRIKNKFQQRRRKMQQRRN